MFGRALPDGGPPPLRRPRQARRAVRAGDRRGRSTLSTSGSRPTPARSRPTSWWSPSAPTCTRAPRPGWSRAGNEFYTVAGAFALREVLANFEGGRVIVGVTSTPFKCPPAPSETALLMHDFLTERGLRDRSRDLAGDAVARADPAVARRVGGAARRLRRARHRLAPRAAGAASSTPAARSPAQPTAARCPTTSSSGIPVHRAPAVVEESGLTVDGWIPVESAHARDTVPGRVRGRRRDQRRHTEGGGLRRRAGRGGRRRDHRRASEGRRRRRVRRHGICYLEFGARPGRACRRHVLQRAGRRPAASTGPRRRSPPTRSSSAASRIQRWFDRTWSQVAPPIG